MTPCNAIIKDWDIRESEGYSRCLELWLELKLQGGGGVIYTVYGVHTKDWQKNQLAYGIKRVLEITGAASIKDLTGKPIRAMFKGDGLCGDVIIGIGNFLEDDWLMLREEELWKKN